MLLKERLVTRQQKMTDKILEKAQNLKKEIDRLEGWINNYESFGGVYRKKIFIKAGKKKGFEFSNPWCALISQDTCAEYGLELTAEQKEKIINILREDLARLKEEYARLGTEENED